MDSRVGNIGSGYSGLSLASGPASGNSSGKVDFFRDRQLFHPATRRSPSDFIVIDLPIRYSEMLSA
jgi:hypothetical protein